MFKIINTLKKAMKVEKPSERDKDRSANILRWDSWNGINDYPIIVLKAIHQSPVAKACMRTKTRFIRGSGFNIPDIESIKVNKEHTLSALHNGLSETVNKLKGIAIHVQRNIEGDIVQLTKMPFEDFRLSLPDEDGNINSIRYNPRWAQTEYKTDETIVYDLYTDNPVTYQKRLNTFRENNAGKKYKGEIYWKYLSEDGFPYYPRPFSEYDLKAFNTDTAFTDFDYNNIFNNFFLGGIMNIYGDPNEIIKEKYYVSDGQGGHIEKERVLGTREELFNEEMQTNFGGGENTGKFMVHWKKVPDDNLEISAFPTNTNSDLFQQTQARVWNKGALITDVPNILANIETSGKLGNSQEILNAIELINDSVSIPQSLLEDAYNELLPKHILFKGKITENIVIKKSNPITFIPDKVWDAIPDKDKKQYVRENYNIDIEELEVIEQPINAMKIKAQSYNDYPQAASDNARKVLDWREEHGDEVEGMTRVGWTRANQLADRENITEDTIGRMAAFERHRRNSDLSEEFRGEPWKDAGYVAWLGWGGDEGIEWAQRKLDELEKEE